MQEVENLWCPTDRALNKDQDINETQKVQEPGMSGAKWDYEDHRPPWLSDIQK